MIDVTSSLETGFERGEARLHAAQVRVAQANAGNETRGADAAMADTAQAAIFTEALLGAVHARFAEVKSVTK